MNAPQTLKKKPADCPDCLNHQRHLEQAVRDRDEALMQLAVAREEANAYRLALAQLPTQTRLGNTVGTPLRYAVVDELNDQLKRALGPLHGQTKKAVGAALNRIKRPKALSGK